MAIQEKSPVERAALYFKSAGLGDRSAIEAARLMIRSGVPFETAAVLGERTDEASTATPAKIREAASRYSSTMRGPMKTTAWGRPLTESAQERLGPAESAPMGEAPATSPATAAAGSAAHEQLGRLVSRHEHPERQKVIDGVLHHEVDEYYEVVRKTPEPDPAVEETGPRLSPWGRAVKS